MAKPKIRFNGYTEDWEQRKLGELVGIYDGVHQTPDYQDSGIMFLSVENIVTLKSEKYIAEEAFERDYKVYPEKGDILMTRIGDVGTTNVVETAEKVAFYVSLALLKPNGIDSYFLSNAMKTNAFQKGLRERTLVTAIPQKINKDEIGKIDIFITNNDEEQKKIGAYFSNLDHLITLHQRKCEQTKTLKKYMLQKMFSQDGEKVPQIRFEGFTEDWEQRKVLDLLIQPITDGPHETPKLVEEGVPFISVDAIVDNKIDFNRKRGNISEEYDELCCKKYKPQFHDVYLVKSGSTVGKVAIVETTDRFNIWSPLAAMRCGEKTYPYFLYDLLQTKDLQAQVADKASNGTQPNLSMRELEKFPVSVPSNLEEQKKIGDYFRNLDHLITLHQRKCDELKEVKKFMLQNMFV